MAHSIQLALGAFITSVGVIGRTKSWEAHECDQQFGENNSTDIEKSQRLWKQGNATINKVSAMRPGLSKIFEKVRISTYFESAETDLHIAENACCIDYSDTWSSKRVHWLAKCQNMNCCLTSSGCENTVEFNAAVAWASLPITTIHQRVAQEYQIPWQLATPHNTEQLDHRNICDATFTVIPVLDLVDVQTACHNSPSHHYCLQWHVWSNGWRTVTISQEEDWMEERLILCNEVCTSQAFQILYWSYSYNWYASQFSTYRWSFPEDAIVWERGKRNAYKSWGQDFIYYLTPGGISEVCG